MAMYLGLIDGEAGAYGIVFPDLPGCVSMGATIEQVIVNSLEAMRLWVETTESAGREVPPPKDYETLHRDPEVGLAFAEGARMVTVPLVRSTRRSVKANLSIDSGILAAIDAEAERRKLTRSSLIEALAREGLHKLG